MANDRQCTRPPLRGRALCGKTPKQPGRGASKGRSPPSRPPIPPGSGRGKTGKAMRPSPRQTALCGEYLSHRRRPQRCREDPAAVPFRPPDPTGLPFRGTAPKRSRSALPDTAASVLPQRRAAAPGGKQQPAPDKAPPPREFSAEGPRRCPPKALFAFLGKSLPHPTRLISPEHCRKRTPQQRAAAPGGKQQPAPDKRLLRENARRRAGTPPLKSPLCLPPQSATPAGHPPAPASLPA